MAFGAARKRSLCAGKGTFAVIFMGGILFSLPVVAEEAVKQCDRSTWYCLDNETSSTVSNTASGASSSKSNWDITLGLGAGYAPRYVGDDRYHVIPVPMVSFVYRDTVFLNPTGLGINVINTHGFKAGPLVGVDFVGRHASDDHARLDGLDTINSSASAGGFLSFTYKGFSIGANLLQDATKTDYGYTGKAYGSYRFPLITDKLDLEAGASADYGSRDDIRTWFGVNEAESMRTGYSYYAPTGGFKDAGVNAAITYHLTQHVLLRTFVDAKKLTGEAADSPLVFDKNQITGGFGVAYHF